MNKSMKYLSVALVSLVALSLSLGTIVRTAQAAPDAAQTSKFVRTWETLGTAAGAIITSPVFVLGNAATCIVAADNSAGGSSRTLNVDWLGSDGTTILYRQAITVTNATRALVSINPQTFTGASGMTVIAAAPGLRMQFTLAAAGAAAGSLAVYCR